MLIGLYDYIYLHYLDIHVIFPPESVILTLYWFLNSSILIQSVYLSCRREEVFVAGCSCSVLQDVRKKSFKRKFLDKK